MPGSVPRHRWQGRKLLHSQRVNRWAPATRAGACPWIDIASSSRTASAAKSSVESHRQTPKLLLDIAQHTQTVESGCRKTVQSFLALGAAWASCQLPAEKAFQHSERRLG